MEAPEVADEWKVNSPGQTRPLLGHARAFKVTLGREFFMRPEVLGGVTDGRAVVSKCFKACILFSGHILSLIMYIFCKSYSWSDIEVIKAQLLT